MFKFLFHLCDIFNGRYYHIIVLQNKEELISLYGQIRAY